MSRSSEPSLCGDPYCPRCFSQPPERESEQRHGERRVFPPSNTHQAFSDRREADRRKPQPAPYTDPDGIGESVRVEAERKAKWPGGYPGPDARD